MIFQELKFVELGESGTGFRLRWKSHFSVQKRDFKKIIFDYKVIVTSLVPSWHPEKVIDRAEFDLRTPVVLEELK